MPLLSSTTFSVSIANLRILFFAAGLLRKLGRSVFLHLAIPVCSLQHAACWYLASAGLLVSNLSVYSLVASPTSPTGVLGQRWQPDTHVSPPLLILLSSPPRPYSLMSKRLFLFSFSLKGPSHTSFSPPPQGDLYAPFSRDQNGKRKLRNQEGKPVGFS